MALETIVFQQDPFTSTYGCKDIYAMDDLEGIYCNGVSSHFHDSKNQEKMNSTNSSNISTWTSPPNSSVAQSHVKEYYSPENEVSTDAFFTGTYPPPATTNRRKRRRIKASKNKEEVENQRMTHIAVERNRRKQMNDYLALLRSLMPPSYAQRGDQASIVGGAINYVKELEQHLQYLESQKQKMKHKEQSKPDDHESDPLTKFFTFPQYSTRLATNQNNSVQSSAEADIEVTMVESHANIKVLSKRQPKQLFKMVSGFQSIGLTVLHLNITTVDHRVLYSFNLKVENDCQVTTVNDIATAVHEMVVMIKEEAIFC